MSYPKTKDGDELTPEFTDQLAAEAEAGFEGYDARWVPAPGRPPLSTAGASRRIQVRVGPELADALDKLADDRGMSMSELLRDAIQKYLQDAA